MGFTSWLAGFIAFRAMVRQKHHGGHSQQKAVYMMVDRMQRGRQELGQELGQDLVHKAIVE